MNEYIIYCDGEPVGIVVGRTSREALGEYMESDEDFTDRTEVGYSYGDSAICLAYVDGEERVYEAEPAGEVLPL